MAFDKAALVKPFIIVRKAIWHDYREFEHIQEKNVTSFLGVTEPIAPVGPLRT